MSDIWQVEGPVSGKKRLQNKRLRAFRSSQEQSEQFSNVLVRIRNAKDFLVRRKDMRKLCYSLQRDTRRMYGIL